MRYAHFLKIRLRKYFSLAFCIFTLFIIYSIISVNVDWEYSADFDYECRSNTSETSLHLTHYCIRGPQIFFTETSGSNILNFRQACAIESTARHNPSMSVTVLMTSSKGIDSTDKLMQDLLSLPNLSIRVIDVDVFMYNTPLWQWFRIGQWKKSKWKVSHLSDALRFLITWRYGGMYLDLDIVTLRSLEHLRNTVITEDWTRVAAGMLIFDKGHKILNWTIHDFCEHYNPKNFVANGPGVISRNIQKFCDIRDFGKVSGAGCDITVLPPDAAFPIKWDEWEKYFQPSQIKNISMHFNSSYMIHVWNKYSKEGKIKIGEGSLYEIAMKEHCPIVYKHAKTQKYV